MGKNWLAATFSAYGAEFVNREGEGTVNSDEVRNLLEYMSRLTQHMPDSVYAWDDASNNRFMIAGTGSAAINPPSIWAVSIGTCLPWPNNYGTTIYQVARRAVSGPMHPSSGVFGISQKIFRRAKIFCASSQQNRR
ncbi:MAG: hypothetical protein CM1200mP4_0870 [Rhodospirillaceae bacterium]|nr:MAG: hypothetical protein CM1200mP4_0870 [Rhodospirillaceae bacterium]